ncbi:MAG: chemotaxis protein CheD [Clostridiales bacterium]|jgi:chemotaxis protein CheD|nr:chemotaxis protein CheD [Clostridiales bacterium]
MGEVIVGMADFKAAKAPEILMTIGLGSCVGIALFDNVNKVAGLAHAMLPNSQELRNNLNPAKFVDTATIALLDEMTRIGAKKHLIKAKLAGGAQMFKYDTTNESMRIGDRNVEAAMKILGKLYIPVIASQTGENFGRTVRLNAADGALTIKTVGRGTFAI